MCVAAGRLTQTWYPAEFIELSMFDMGMRPNSSDGNPGSVTRHLYLQLLMVHFRRGHRFYTGEAVYPFGYGLRSCIPLVDCTHAHRAVGMQLHHVHV